MSGYILTLDEAQALLAKRDAEIERLRAEIEDLKTELAIADHTNELGRKTIERLRADKEHLLALLRKAANEIDELGFPSKADEFLSAIIVVEQPDRTKQE